MNDPMTAVYDNVKDDVDSAAAQKERPAEHDETVEPAVRIENWSLHEKCGDRGGHFCWKSFRHLHGNAYGHPYVPDGEYMHTSRLLAVSGNVAVCKSRVWHLGKPK